MTAITHCHRTESRSWSRRIPMLALVALGLGACSPIDADVSRTMGWLQASSPKELQVDQAQYRHTVYFDTDRDEIRASERDRLFAFLDAVEPTGNDSVRIEGHADERANDVYNLDLAARRNESVSRFLSQHGVSSANLHASAFGERAPAAAGSGPEAWKQNRRVDIVLERYLVTPPACPDWSRRSGVDFANLPHSNFGCATQTNLGLMIANPRDLVRGRRVGPADGVHQAEGIVRYREGRLPKLQEERVN